MSHVGSIFLACCRAGLIGGVLLAAVCLWSWQRDRQEIAGRLEDVVVADASASDKMRAAVAYLRDEVAYGRKDGHFLLPVFRPLKPTALQVLDRGGLCAYRARALIVMLDVHGVSATKFALYTDGRPVHAAVEVTTEKGLYIVDALYNVIHEDEQGRPIPLRDLADEKVLAASLARAGTAGNPRVADYRSEYVYEDVRTFNWHKSRITRAAHAALAWAFGEEWVHTIERPYFTEEPALMVFWACIACVAFCGLVLWRARRRRAYQQMPL